VHAAETPTVAVGAESAGDAASPPRGTRPVTEPVASVFRSADAASGTGTHRAIPDSGVVAGTGAFRVGSRSAAPEGTGSHRAASGTGSYPAAEPTHVSGTGGYRRNAADLRSDDDGEHTRALPTVPDEQR
jgi:hypothetical protein